MSPEIDGWWSFLSNAVRTGSQSKSVSPRLSFGQVSTPRPTSWFDSSTALQRLNYLVYLLDVRGSQPDPAVPRATGTQVDLTAFLADAADAAKLVDRISLIATGGTLPSAARDAVVKGVSVWTAANDPADWRARRVRTAAFLVFGSPNYQVQR